MAETAIEIITRNVLAEISAKFEGAVAQLNAELEAARVRGDQLFESLETEGRQRMAELFDELPAAAVITEDGRFDPLGWFKAQAKSRALRTLVQGLIAAVFVAVGNAVIQAFAKGSLDIFSWEDWKFVGALAGTAVIGAVVAYVQNALGIKPPPKVQ